MNPLSGLWAREELINPKIFPPGCTHSTFSSNPLGTAAGLATMELLKKNDYESIVNDKGAYLLEALRNLKKRYPVIGDVDALGLAVRIELTKSDGFTPDRNLTDAIFQAGLSEDIEADGKQYGLVLDVGGYYKNAFTLAPALTISYDELDLFVRLFELLLKRCSA
jgi:4-aminobutyrate aminotransferase-like enzyme